MVRVNYYLKRPVEKLSQAVGRLCCNSLRYRGYFNFKVRGLEFLPNGPAIIVSNHCIGIDGVILATQLPKPSHFLIQSEGVYNSWMKPLLWAFGEIPVGADKRSSKRMVFKRAEDYLRWSKDFVVVFGEGPAKRLVGKDKKIIPIEKRRYYCGAAHLAEEVGVPIVPIGLWTPEVIRDYLWAVGGVFKEKMEGLGNYWKQPGKIPYFINIGRPIEKEKIISEAKERLGGDFREGGKCAEALTDVVQREICKLVKKAEESYFKN